MPDTLAEVGLGTPSREVYQFWRDGLLAADHAATEINGLAARPDTLLSIVYQIMPSPVAREGCYDLKRRLLFQTHLPTDRKLFISGTQTPAEKFDAKGNS